MKTHSLARDAERTRQALLEAASIELARHGIAASLDAIARQAGVSKGGLLHHFPTKGALFLALTQDVYASFDAEVAKCLAREPHSPGRLARAYIKTMFAALHTPRVISSYGTLIPLLATEPRVAEFTGAEYDRWEKELSADGIPLSIARIAILATDGAALATLHYRQAATTLKGTEKSLLALIDHHAQIAQVLP